jgi:hypothetical protein
MACMHRMMPLTGISNCNRFSIFKFDCVTATLRANALIQVLL